MRPRRRTVGAIAGQPSTGQGPIGMETLTLRRATLASINQGAASVTYSQEHSRTARIARRAVSRRSHVRGPAKPLNRSTFGRIRGSQISLDSISVRIISSPKIKTIILVRILSMEWSGSDPVCLPRVRQLVRHQWRIGQRIRRRCISVRPRIRGLLTTRPTPTRIRSRAAHLHHHLLPTSPLPSLLQTS